ncbi:MAG: VPLPA-CTERM sorting domain-containing protein [Pseudomonadota bacterium]
MKNLIIAGAVSLAAMANASANVINFEALGDVSSEGDAFVGNEFASQGVLFSSTDNMQLVRVGSPQAGFAPQDTPNPSNALGNWFLSTAFNDSVTDLTITWTNPIDEFSFDMADIDDDEVFTFTVRDASNTVIETREIKSGDTGTGNQLVTRVAFTGLGNQLVSLVIEGEKTAPVRLGIAFDNFAVDSSAIPVPAALPLFAAGLAGFGAFRRRQGAKA